MVHSTHIYLPMKMEQTECSETLAYKLQTAGNYPKENIQRREYGESLKSRINIHLTHLRSYIKKCFKQHKFVFFFAVSVVLLCCCDDINETLCVSRFWMQQEAKTVCTWPKRCCCTVLTAAKSHTWNTLIGTRDFSHALPTITNLELSGSCGVHSFTDPFTLTYFLKTRIIFHFT